MLDRKHVDTESACVNETCCIKSFECSRSGEKSIYHLSGQGFAGFFLFLRGMTFRYCLSSVDSFVLHLSNSLKYFKDTRHNMLRDAKSSVNYSLGITWFQKYNFMPVTFIIFQLKKLKQTMCFCNRLLATECKHIYNL